MNLYARQGNYKKAYQRAAQHADIQLWLQRVRQSRETHLQLSQWKNTVALARKEAQIRQLASRQQGQRWLLVGVSAVAVLATVFVFLLRRSRQRVERQRAELSQLNATKNRLFSVVSHDLRGPVLTLRQSLERLEQVPAPARPETLNRLRQSVNGLVALTDNLLLYALAELDGLTTMPRPVPLPMVLTSVLSLYREPVRQKRLSIAGWPLPAAAADVPDWLVLADETHVEIAIRNVWQNAVKFSPDGGQITISVVQQPHELTVLIANQGPGFSWPPPVGTVPLGTGLGLQVVQNLIDRNNGTLRVEAGPTGPTVRLSWPRPPAAPAYQSLQMKPEKYEKSTSCVRDGFTDDCTGPGTAL